MAWNPKTGFGKFIDWLTFGLFSKNEDGSSNGLGGLFNPQNWKNTGNDIVNSDDFLPGQEKSLNDSIGDLFGTSGIGGLIRSLTDRFTAAHLTGAEREQNQFNAEQAAIDRQFQQDMSNTAYQRSVADMRAAGVNPALAMQQGGASTPSGSTASGSGSGLGASMSELMQLLMIKPQMELLKAQTDKTKAEADKTGKEAGLVEKHVAWFDRLSQSQLDDIYSAIDRRDVQNSLDKQGISESMAREALVAQQTINAHIDEQYISKLNDAQIKYQEALTAYTNQKTKESAEQVKLMAAQIDGIYQQAILHAAQAGYFSQQEQNLLEQVGILQYEKEQHKFTVEHQKADRNWRIVSTIFGTAQQIGMTAGSLAVGAGSLAKSGLLGQTSITASPWSFHNTGGFNFITY